MVAMQESVEPIGGKVSVWFSSGNSRCRCWWFNDVVLIVGVKELGGSTKSLSYGVGCKGGIFGGERCRQ